MKSNPSETSSTMDYKKILCLMLGLDATKATDAEIETAATQFASDEKDEDGTMAATEAVKPVAEKVTAMSTSLVTLNARLDSIERANITARAIAAGKIVPMGVEKLPLAEFKTMIDSLAADQVPLEKRTVEGVQAFSASSKTIGANTADDQIRKTLGISEETWKKYNS